MEVYILKVGVTQYALCYEYNHNANNYVMLHSLTIVLL